MSEVTVKQISGATFAARGSSNHWTMIDVAESVGGQAAASGPMEMVLFGLGGCTGVDVENMLRKMKIPIQHFEIKIHAERAEEHPKVYTSIQMTYHFYGERLPLPKLERAVKLSKETYCSVSAMLGATVDISTKIEVHPST